MSDARSQAVSRKCSTDTVISWRDPLAQTNSASPAISSGQPRPSFDREPLLVPHKSPSTPKYPEHASADTVDGSIGTEDSESTSDIYCPPRTGMRTMRPRSRSNSSRVGRGPRSVQLETVNGVRLDTMPTNPRASQIGLCIPEIEARDIRQIEDDQFVDDEYLPLDAASRQQCASSPPPIGARQDFVRNISPRPPTVGRDHIFVDNYSRAVVQSHGLDALIEQPDEHSRERPRVPAQAPDRWSSDETQVDSSDGTAAPSPSIARTRVSDLRDVEMTSKTKQVRDLLKGMLKGCVVDRNKPTVSKARKESIDNQHRPASKGSVADRESFEEMIQRTIIQGERQRANAQISTHG
ncbi:hypothetical protein H2198_008551 [Neophaeococcomyces mojaviensis]|uniref:Uncharacterized protein n=1 Tax=Neophaeococcomyces mojaviensis TaxID=3383035 RepID=A0ACC2ZWT1_9EURO|nr:hypothetical protein H2198_008551 [Knufia sp. JES_112]